MTAAVSTLRCKPKRSAQNDAGTRHNTENHQETQSATDRYDNPLRPKEMQKTQQPQSLELKWLDKKEKVSNDSENRVQRDAPCVPWRCRTETSWITGHVSDGRRWGSRCGVKDQKLIGGARREPSCGSQLEGRAEINVEMRRRQGTSQLSGRFPAPWKLAAIHDMQVVAWMPEVTWVKEEWAREDVAPVGCSVTR